jgi:hypothetical protein
VKVLIHGCKNYIRPDQRGQIVAPRSRRLSGSCPTHRSQAATELSCVIEKLMAES